MARRITDLPQIVSGLDGPARERFDRLFDVAASEARVFPPEPMEDWIAKVFAYLAPTREAILEAIRHQPIVHVRNRVTCQATLYNAVRSQRPIEAKDSADVEEAIASAREKCAFCRPLELTPENSFGRIADATCANVAAYDGWHGLVVFEEHSPLEFRTDAFSADRVRELVKTSLAWAEKARAEDAEARYFFLMWNCLWKAGASIIHGHAQMTLGRRFHYGKVERLRRDAAAYRAERTADYFADLAAAHADLGLAAEWDGVRALAHLTPVKEKEIVLVCRSLDAPETAEAIYRALRVYAALDVKCYNLAVYMPPLGEPDPAWEGFPVLVHLVDRGDPGAKTADVGAMELYSSTVVAGDPFVLAEAMNDVA
jgi:hypothetical protein